MNDHIKIVTAPDLIYDQSLKITAVCPRNDLKQSLERWILDQDRAVTVYYYTIGDSDIQWLLTVSNLSDILLLDVDNCDEVVGSLASYLISLPQAHYRSENPRAPWNLLNSNRFYDFPDFER